MSIHILLIPTLQGFEIKMNFFLLCLITENRRIQNNLLNVLHAVQSSGAISTNGIIKSDLKLCKKQSVNINPIINCNSSNHFITYYFIWSRVFPVWVVSGLLLSVVPTFSLFRTVRLLRLILMLLFPH